MWLFYGYSPEEFSSFISKMKKKLFFLLFCSSVAYSQVNEIPRVQPEQVGISSKAVIETLDSLMVIPDNEIHTAMILRHGKVISEFYQAPFVPESRPTLYSCSKTFVGIAVGLAVSENRLAVTDRVAALLPEYLPETISRNLSLITVEDLLRMTSGITPDWKIRDRCTNWINAYLSREVKEPGTEFHYDSMCSYLLSAIVQKVTGMTTLDYLKAKVFRPLHITEVDWEVSPEGFNTGGWGLRLQTESMAKIGLLLLNKGVWEGKQIIPEDWVRQMMTRQYEAGSEDYCFQMRMCDYPGTVRADGAFGQYIIIAPNEDMVFAFTQCSTRNGKQQRHVLWDHLLSQVDKNIEPSDSKDYKKLLAKQSGYSLAKVKGRRNSKYLDQINNRVISLEKNRLGWKSVCLDFDKENIRLKIVNDKEEVSTIPLGYKEWSATKIDSYPPYSVTAIGRYKGITGPFSVSGNYGWTSSRQLVVKLVYTDWISCLDLYFDITDPNHISLNVKENYNFNPYPVKTSMTDN